MHTHIRVSQAHTHTLDERTELFLKIFLLSDILLFPSMYF